MATVAKHTMDRLKVVIGGALVHAPASVQVRYKRLVELLFWRKTRRSAGGQFYNGHMQTAFTRVFGLAAEDYRDRRILDIGCGPIGTLEWADMAAERVGVDPLATEYLRLNNGSHRMTYVTAPAERLPFGDGHFDTVSMFNALDHVEEVSAAIAEAVRVTRPGGRILLIVEVDHRPTITEPNVVRTSVLEAFAGCRVEMQAVYRIRDDHDVYASVFEAVPRTDSSVPGVLCARLTKAGGVQ